MKNKYFYFVSNFIFFILIVAFLDFIIGKSLKHYYFSLKSGESYQTTYSMDSTNAEIIILGSSRANHHYISNTISKSLKMSCYNTGRDGNYLFYSNAVYNSIINRYTPKIVILDISPEDIYFSQSYYDVLSTLFPYYEEKLQCKKLINLDGKYVRLRFLSSTYPYNSRIIEILGHNLIDDLIRREKRRDLDSLNGYRPLFGSDIHNVIKKNKELTETIDKNNVRILSEMAEECNKQHIKLLVICSPRYINRDVSINQNIIRKIVESNHEEFISFMSDTIFMNNPSLFKDEAHLNNNGANIFTNLIIDKLKNNLPL